MDSVLHSFFGSSFAILTEGRLFFLLESTDIKNLKIGYFGEISSWNHSCENA